jgi:RecJ-like exonuclease
MAEKCPTCGGRGKVPEEDVECGVCSATPDADGVISHGRGCRTQSKDGGGTSYAEMVPCPTCGGAAEPKTAKTVDVTYSRGGVPVVIFSVVGANAEDVELILRHAAAVVAKHGIPGLTSVDQQPVEVGGYWRRRCDGQLAKVTGLAYQSGMLAGVSYRLFDDYDRPVHGLVSDFRAGFEEVILVPKEKK